jgi:hypothetical protein
VSPYLLGCGWIKLDKREHTATGAELYRAK